MLEVHWRMSTNPFVRACRLYMYGSVVVQTCVYVDMCAQLALQQFSPTNAFKAITQSMHEICI